MNKKLLGIGLLLIFLPMLTALRVENLSALFENVPIGVAISYYPTHIPKITNNTPYAVTYQISFNTAQEASVNPASERTPYLREFKCSNPDCEETFVLDDRIARICPYCNSSNIKGRVDEKGNKVFLYNVTEEQKPMFQYIEPIPDTSFIRARPSQITLEPYETKELKIYMEFPDDPAYFDKFYEVLISVYPVIEKDKYITFKETVTSEATTELQHHLFNLTIEGDSTEIYQIIKDETYPLVTTSNDLIDMLAVRVDVNKDWWEIYPLYNLPFKFPYNRMFPTDIQYKTKDINKIGETDVAITLRYKKVQPTVVSAISGRIWIHTVKDEAQNQAVIKSGKINIVDPSEMPTETPTTNTPFKTTSPPIVPPQENGINIIWVVVGVIVILFLVLVYFFK